MSLEIIANILVFESKLFLLTGYKQADEKFDFDLAKKRIAFILRRKITLN